MSYDCIVVDLPLVILTLHCGRGGEMEFDTIFTLPIECTCTSVCVTFVGAHLENH